MRGLLLMLLALVASPAAFAQPASEWVTLGTSGGPAVQRERSQIANALVMPGGAYLFDTGNGVQRQMALARIAERDVKVIFLSHHHLDHVADLGPLLWTRWTFGGGPLIVVGPQGTKALVEGLIAASAPITLAGYPVAGPAKPALADLVTVIEIPADLAEPTQVYADARIKVGAIGVDHYQSPSSIPLDHMPQAVAYRVEAGGRTIVYTGDSGPSARLTKLAKGADLLVTEVVEPDAIAALLTGGAQGSDAARAGIVRGMTMNHLTPGEVGKMAQAAGVKRVVLTHFVPSPENVPDRGVYARGIGQFYKGPLRLANDLDRF